MNKSALSLVYLLNRLIFWFVLAIFDSMLKKAASLFILLAVLVSSTGIILRTHSCRKMAISRTYFLYSPLNCCQVKGKLSCSVQGEKINKNCCQFSFEYKFLDTEKRVNPDFELNTPDFSAAVFCNYTWSIARMAGIWPEKVDESPPPRSSLEILLENCVLRVWSPIHFLLISPGLI